MIGIKNEEEQSDDDNESSGEESVEVPDSAREIYLKQEEDLIPVP